MPSIEILQLPGSPTTTTTTTCTSATIDCATDPTIMSASDNNIHNSSSSNDSDNNSNSYSVSSSSSYSASTSSSSLPPFTLTGDKYDQNTYYGRFRKMMELVDPRTLLCTQNDLNESRNSLDEFKNNTTTMMSAAAANNDNYNMKLWNAKHIVDSMTHPDTGEIIPRPFRMSGFIPYNAPMCVGALIASSPYSILFWQWSNQTHNALINYYNGNKTQPIDPMTTIQGYVGAVTGACGVSLGLKSIIDKSKKLDLAQKIKMQRFVALPAIITAAAINVVLMRRNELTTGINVYYEQQQQQQEMNNSKDNDNDDAKEIVVVGTSQIAARKGLKEMVISRMVLPLPVFLLPPIGLSMIESFGSPAMKNMLQKNKHATVGINAMFVLLGFTFGLPATIALFPQIGTVPATDLEERFHNLRDSNNELIRNLQYNKGL